MKRIVFYVATMLVTFALGFGIHNFISQRQVDPPAPVETISVDTLPFQVPLAPPIPTVSADTPDPILVLDYDPEKFTPWAVFYVMGNKPKDFANIDWIELGLPRDVDDPKGYLFLAAHDTGDNYVSALATFALVSEQRLFFATSRMPNTEFEYWFDGRFLRTDFNAVERKHVAVLRGTLTKTRNGRKVAEHTFNFRMQHLGC